ncbi:MAG: PilN domain-containing protein [Candidatus Latescibacterota bacterium]
MYIRINLLPQDLRPKKTLFHFDVKAILVLFALVAAAGIAGYTVFLQQELHTRNTLVRQLRNEEASLKDTVELQKQVDELRGRVVERVEIIRQLTADSDVRFDMLKHINGIIPENLWLMGINEMGQSGPVAFTIEGMSYSKKDISRFINGLQHYKKFNSVALESISPSPLEVRDAFQFIVRVELASVQPPVEEKSAKKPSKTAVAVRK